MTEIDPAKIRAAVAARRRSAVRRTSPSMSMSLTAGGTPAESVEARLAERRRIQARLGDLRASLADGKAVVTKQTKAPAAQPRRPLTVADLTPDQYTRASLAFHEAGHAIAGVLFGGELDTATVSAKGGETTFSADDNLAIGRHPAVAFAGPYAEARWCAGGLRRPTVYEVDRIMCASGRKDRAAITAAGATPSEVAHDVTPLLDRCWPSLVTLAVKLNSDGEARHADVCAALSIPATGNSHHLSLIRSGSAPGSFVVRAAEAG